MTVKIAHASIDENGKTMGGKSGDQSGKEVCIRDWYNKPWHYVIRFKDKDMRERIAHAMEAAAKNDHIGYDQWQRNTALIQGRKVGYNPGRIAVDCETDCSALVSLCCVYAGIDERFIYSNGNSCTTRNLRAQLEKTGQVEVFNAASYTTKSDKLIRGDILLKEGSHVAVVVQSPNSIVQDKLDKESEEFITKIGQAAIRAYIKQGKVKPSVCIGMACVECGYGKAGSVAHHSYLGHKVGTGKTATKYWGGAFFTSKTVEEYKVGEHSIIRAAFRAYESMEQCVMNFYELLNTKLYARVKADQNFVAQMQAIKAAGYMTSSTEVTSVLSIIQKNKLSRFDDEAVDQIARRVLAGDFGNGDARLKAIEERGWDYFVIQKRVNELLKVK